MEIKEVLSVSGQPGLYRYVAQAHHGIVVERIDGQGRQCIPASAQVSALSEIAIYTSVEERPLPQVFTSMLGHAESSLAIDPKKASNDEVRALFEQVVPDYDRERVYVAHMRKALRWFQILHAAGIRDFTVTTDEEEGESSSNPKQEEA